MKILLDVSAAIPPLSGVGRYAVELARRLPGQPGVDEIRYLRGGRVSSELEVGAAAPSSSWRKQVRRFLPYMLLAPYRRRRARQLAGTLAAFDDHVFHSTNFSMPPVSGPSVVTIHDMSVFHLPEYHPRDRVNYLCEQISHSVERAHRLVTGSEFVRREILDHFAIDPDRVVAIPLGVDASFQPRSADTLAGTLSRLGLSAGGYLLNVGTIEPRKNLPGLLDAYRRLDAGIRNRFPLVIAGAYGWKGADTLDDIRRLEASGEVIYLDYVPEQDLPLLYAGAAAFCYFSFYEGFGLPVLESFASDVPVVCADIPALRELGGEDALFADPNDPLSMATALEQALTDTGWRESAIARGRERAAAYTWDRTASLLVDLFTGIAR